MEQATDKTVDVLAARADSLVAAYANAAPRYIRGRRDAAVLHANDERLTGQQKSYWLRIANGCDGLLSNVSWGAK